MNSRGGKAAGFWVDGAINYVGGENVRRVGVRVAQEVGEGDGGEGEVVGVGGFVEFDHCGDGFDYVEDLMHEGSEVLEVVNKWKGDQKREVLLAVMITVVKLGKGTLCN